MNDKKMRTTHISPIAFSRKMAFAFLLCGLLVMSGCGSDTRTISCLDERPTGSVELILKAGKDSAKVEILEVILTYPLNFDETLAGAHLPLEAGDADGTKQKQRLLQEAAGKTLGISPDLVSVKKNRDDWTARAQIRNIPALFETLGLESPDLDFDALKAELESSSQFACTAD